MADDLNQYCWCGTVRKFLESSQEDWMAEMERRHRRASPYDLSRENLRAWKNSFSVLQTVFRELPPAFLKLHLIFEYCLPRYPPKNGVPAPYYIWADAILVSRDAAVVLEFKDRSDAIIQHARQARMYRNRLQNIHDSSIGMRKWSILVPTLSCGLLAPKAHRVTAASPDRLAEALLQQFGTAPRPYQAITHWIHSTYSVHH